VEHHSAETFPLLLTEHQRDALIHATRLRARIKNLLLGIPKGSQPVEFTEKELSQISEEIDTAAVYAPSPYKKRLVAVQRKVMDLLDAVADKAEVPRRRRTPTINNTILQFKITLRGIKPPIWRRIQTKDCTLDKLHEHIQTAMGWTNSHLHQFEIGGVRYGDPQLLYEGWEDETSPVNSLRTKLSKIIPKDGKRFRFDYEYDFGDGWEHEILFEGFLPAEKGTRYPLCLEGERACPPEDVGGTYGYQECLKAMANPKHKRHKEFLEWSGPFDPEKFDAEAATKQMRKGLPDWRNEEWI